MALSSVAQIREEQAETVQLSYLENRAFICMGLGVSQPHTSRLQAVG